ncbi:hypothetical protein U1Q18_045108 [Sarracenia purpurea var. burkii]
MPNSEDRVVKPWIRLSNNRQDPKPLPCRTGFAEPPKAYVLAIQTNHVPSSFLECRFIELYRMPSLSPTRSEACSPIDFSSIAVNESFVDQIAE